MKPRDLQQAVTASSNQRGSTRLLIRWSWLVVVILALPFHGQEMTYRSENAFSDRTVLKLRHSCQRVATTPARDLSIPAGPSPKARGPPEISTKTCLVIFLSNSSCHEVVIKGLSNNEVLLCRFPLLGSTCHTMPVWKRGFWLDLVFPW